MFLRESATVFLGWHNAAPFDKIIVTCSPESVPKPLIDQLREGGQMIIPVGERYQQTLFKMTKQDGELVRQPLRPTLFVPMTGTAEDRREHLPDGANPTVINGDFADAGTPDEQSKADFVPGWYYGRQVRQMNVGDSKISSSRVPFVRFQNDTPGLSSHLLQGIAVEGKKVSMVRLSGRGADGEYSQGADDRCDAIDCNKLLRQTKARTWDLLDRTLPRHAALEGRQAS